MLDNVEPSILCIELPEQVLVVVVFLNIPLFFASVFFTVFQRLFFFSLNENIMTRLGSKKNVNPNQNSMFSNQSYQRLLVEFCYLTTKSLPKHKHTLK